MALITVARCQVAALEGVATERLTILIAAAQAILERECNRHFESAARTPTLDGNGERELLLPDFPVTALSKVTVIEDDGSTVDLAGANFRIHQDLGKIRFLSTATCTYLYFPRGFQNIQPAYTGGFAVIPEDIQEATVQTVVWLHHRGQTDPAVKSERLGDFAQQFAMGDGTGLRFIRSLISSYKDVEV